MTVNFAAIVPNLCLEEYSPLLLCGWTIQFLQNYFSSGENLQHPSFRSRLYAPDTETGLWIGSAGSFLPVIAEKRPAILVRHGEAKFEPISIGMTNAYTEEHEGHTDYHQAQRVVDTVIVQCLARSYDETAILGWEALSAFLKLCRVIALQTNLRVITATGLGGIAALDESRTIYATGFPVQYDFVVTWTTTSQQV